MQTNIILKTVNAYLRTLSGRYIKPIRYDQIFNEIRTVKPKIIVEVGTWNGARAEKMIGVASENVSISSIEYIGFDLFEDITGEIYSKEISKHPPTLFEVKEMLSKSGSQIKLFKGLTQNTISNILKWQRIDFAFIDGGHDSETVKNDWEGIEKVMDKNTVVIFDDYWQNRSDGPKVVIDSIDRKKYKVEIMPYTDVFFNPDFGRLVINLVKVTLK